MYRPHIVFWISILLTALLCSSCAPVPASPQEPVAPPEPDTISTMERSNNYGMTFSRVPAGSFMMGSPENEIGRDGDERQHQVTLSEAYYLQTTEVTQGQWQEVMGNNPAFFQNCGPDCPMENISWDDAQNFIEKLNDVDTSYNYRLPTEAEWEYAARAGSTTALPNGNLLSDDLFVDKNLEQVGWYVGNSERATHPVARKAPNRWGLFDMHGNVREWCNDWHHVYPHNEVVDPQGPQTGWSKIRRGGSWNLYTRFLRSASRDWSNMNTRDPFTGFRLVQSSKPPKTVQKTQIIEARKLTWEVQFDYDKADIVPSMQPTLKEVLANARQDDRLLLAGHTCDLGTEPYNLTLSKQRVEAIERHFLKHGIKAQQISIEFYGEEDPAYPNETDQGRSRNRRVTIQLIPAPQDAGDSKP